MQALCKVPAETSNIYFSLLPICFTKEGLEKLEEAVNRKCALHSISLNAEQDLQRDQIYIYIWNWPKFHIFFTTWIEVGKPDEIWNISEWLLLLEESGWPTSPCPPWHPRRQSSMGGFSTSSGKKILTFHPQWESWNSSKQKVFR